MIHKKSLIFIAGHNGMVGSAIKRKLIEKGYNNLLFKSKKQLDLLWHDMNEGRIPGKEDSKWFVGIKEIISDQHPISSIIK